MLLTMDVGNTNIVLGVFDGNKLKVHWRISTNRQHTEDEYGVTIRNLFYHCGVPVNLVTSMIISSVMPPLISPLENMSRRYFDIVPIVVGPGIKTGLNILMENPREVGADRIVNAVGGFTLYGGPLIIVDFGTAITFCAISEKAEYLGGAIAPGIGISTEALFEKASKLPRVEFIKPKRVIGKETVSSMQSGIFYGFVGQVDGIVSRMFHEFSKKPMVIATGGWASLIARESKTIDKVSPFLTLEGLRIIYERNK